MKTRVVETPTQEILDRVVDKAATEGYGNTKGFIHWYDRYGADTCVNLGDNGLISYSGKPYFLKHPSEYWLMSYSEYLINYKESKENKLMSTISKLKKLTLTKEERLLRKWDIHNDCGDLTEEGKEVLWTIVEAAHKEELVKKITELDKEEKKCKKDCSCEKCK